MAYSRLKCPKCGEDFGQEARFNDHLIGVHGITDCLSFFVELNHIGHHPTCACSPECNVKLPWAGWKKGFTSKFARGHNARIDSIYLDTERQKQFAEKRAEGYKSGRLKIWCEGETVETNQTLASSAKKKSVTLLHGYASGKYVPWQHRDPSTIKRSLEKLSASKRLSPEEIARRIAEMAPNFELVSESEAYVRRQRSRLQVKCKTCGVVTDKSLEMLETTPRCFTCNPVSSYPEIQLFEFVKGLLPGEEIISGTRKVIAPQELDIYVPSHRFAIEYNGLTFHTEQHVLQDYHSSKTSRCSVQGITLMHVFSDEWRDKTEIIKSMIQSRLGTCECITGARKCTIVLLKPGARKAFFKQNHVDGDVKATIAWGLCDPSGTLMAALSLRKPNRHSKQKYAGAIELARFCTVINSSIPGALGRLSKHALRWAKSNGFDRLFTYVDLRHGTGKGYGVVGFVKIGVTPNRFWWTNMSGRDEDRHRFDRSEVHADAKNGITEKEAARKASVMRVWGCPNLVLELR